jgi:glycosyltransferase involved in cell wall biosynthesis
LLQPPSSSIGSFERILQIAKGISLAGHEPIILGPNGVIDIFHGTSTLSEAKSLYRQKRYDAIKHMIYHKGLGKLLLPIAGQVPIPGISQVLRSAIREYAIDVLQVEQEAAALLVNQALANLPVPIVVDFHGVWAEELAWEGVFRPSSFPYRFLQLNTTRMLRRVRGVIVMNEYMRDYVIRNYNLQASNIETIDMAVLSCVDNVRPRCENPRVVYAGQVSHEKWSELFIDSIPYIARKYPSAEFFVTARGDLLERLNQAAKASRAKIELFWFNSKQEVTNLVSTCNVGVLTLAQNESYRISPASKFFEYATAGVPVVANDVGGWISIVRNRGVGFLASNEPESMAEATVKFLAEPSVSLEYGNRILSLVKNEFSIWNTVALLDNFYKKVVAG